MNETVLNFHGRLRSVRHRAIAPLRQPVNGNWILLFSHPEDFAVHGFEADRWLLLVRDEFAAARVRPLADSIDHDVGWVAAVGCDDEPPAELWRKAWTGLHENHAMPLNPGERFVLMLDEMFRLRWSLIYTPGDALPSPISMAAIVRSKRLASHQPASDDVRVFRTCRFGL